MAFRLVLVCLLLLAAAYAGVFLGSITAQGWAPGAWALPFGVLTCGAFLLGCAFFLIGLPTIIQFIRCGEEHLRDCLTKISPALLLYFVSALASVPLVSGLTVKTVQPGQSSLGLIFGQASAHDTVLLPFYAFEGKSNNCSPRQTNFGPAAEITNSQMRDAVQGLAKSLAACSSNQSGLVRIDVRGFASSSDFKGCDEPKHSLPVKVSDTLNLRLAEARRQTIVKLITDVAGDRIRLDPSTPTRWNNNIEAMRYNQHFNDRALDNSYDVDRAAFTRRAEIVILDKAACEPR
jgi:hypothetical protein